ncbi:TOPRS ligase, partial [Chunga burmeisteri]|nr:TOPRS ligase [Chunga burmeisteri]
VPKETEWSCPICRNARHDVAYAMPCRHQFCLGCIVRWAQVNTECPLCRGVVEAVRFCVKSEDNYLQCIFIPPEESPDASNQAGIAPGRLAENSPHQPMASSSSSRQGILSQAEQGAAGPEAVGGLLPQVWAELFQRHKYLLHPVLPWLRQVLKAIYGAQWWQVKSAESSILHALCVYGPHGDVMVQALQDYLKDHTAPLVHGIIGLIVCRCSEEARRLLGSSATGDEDNSPATSLSPTASNGGTPAPDLASSSSATDSNRDHQPSMSEATHHGISRHPSSAPIPAEQEQPREEPGQVAAAGSAVHGSSCSPSAPGWGRDRWPWETLRPPKRRAPSSQDSPQPCKRP